MIYRGLLCNTKIIYSNSCIIYLWFLDRMFYWFYFIIFFKLNIRYISFNWTLSVTLCLLSTKSQARWLNRIKYRILKFNLWNYFLIMIHILRRQRCHYRPSLPPLSSHHWRESKLKGMQKLRIHSKFRLKGKIKGNLWHTCAYY